MQAMLFLVWSTQVETSLLAGRSYAAFTRLKLCGACRGAHNARCALRVNMGMQDVAHERALCRLLLLGVESHVLVFQRL